MEHEIRLAMHPSKVTQSFTAIVGADGAVR
jgi:hypothetical protein